MSRNGYNTIDLQKGNCVDVQCDDFKQPRPHQADLLLSSRAVRLDEHHLLILSSWVVSTLDI